jgi:hypothetical protein
MKLRQWHLPDRQNRSEKTKSALADKAKSKIKMMILFRITNAYIHDFRNEVRRSQLQIRQDEKTTGIVEA